MNPLIEFFLTRAAGRFFRKVLTIASGWAGVHGLTALTAPTIENVASLGAGVVGLGLSWAWSKWHDKLNFAKGSARLESPSSTACPKTQQILQSMAPMLLVGLFLGVMMTGCQSPKGLVPVGVNADGTSAAPTPSETFLATIKVVDQKTGAFLASPIVQAGAEPAGAVLTGAALWSYQLAGGNDVGQFAGWICSWCQVSYSILGGQAITPDQANAAGSVFTASLNAADAKYAPAFGQVQSTFDRMVKSVGGTPGLARDTLVKFVKGVQMAASNFITGS